MDKRLTGNSLILRDNKMVQARLQGRTYTELAQQFGVSTSRVGQVLTKEEIKTLLDGGTAEMIGLIPKACDVQDKAMSIKDDLGNPTALAVKASENALKIAAIMPSNTTNQTITQIYNIQNNITLSAGVAKALSQSLTSRDPDVIDGEYTDDQG